jgi:alpha-ketoglutarate-dependent taurine dioxygenase
MTSTLTLPTSTCDALDLDRLGPGFGANVHGLDLATADDDAIAAVRQALTAHKVLFFPGSGSIRTARWPWATGWGG